MSHFSVLVVLDHPDQLEDALAPYDENLSVPSYPDPISEDSFTRFVKFYRDRGKLGETYTEEDLKQCWENWSGNELVKTDTGYASMSTYNPNSKWDWYQVGGRWRGFFRVKPGTPEDEYQLGEASWMDSGRPSQLTADIVRKKDVNINSMIGDALSQHLPLYDQIAAATTGYPVPLSFAEVRAAYNDDLEASRKAYWEQPWIAAARTVPEVKEMFFFEPDEYLMSRDEFITKIKDTAIATFAVLINGQWIERGQMGWFGCATNKKDDTQWGKEFLDLWNQIDDNAWLVLVDCHI